MAQDVKFLGDKIEAWFKGGTASHRLYIPCAISPGYSPPFVIGPIRFSHLSDFRADKGIGHDEFCNQMFERVFNAMQNEQTFWMATLEVADCMDARARELGDLAVDIALAGLQLVVPLQFSQYMTRMTARSAPRHRETVSLRNGAFSHSSENREPGVTLGEGALEQFVKSGAPILKAIGHRVAAYLDVNAPLLALEQAWADAAYWFHEGLAEPLDTIAVAKLETCIEVLLSAGSTTGSKSRLVTAIKAFYGKGPNDTINPRSPTTVTKFAEDLVEHRSRVLHGNWSTLMTNLQDSRSILTVLTLDPSSYFSFT